MIVGEYNPHGHDGQLALHPFLTGATGARLCWILGMDAHEYLKTFARVNLLMTPAWSRRLAREEANQLTHRRRILLGARVAEAHGLRFKPFTVWHSRREGHRAFDALILPHPSGRCRIWNDPVAAVRARIAVEQFLK